MLMEPEAPLTRRHKNPFQGVAGEHLGSVERTKGSFALPIISMALCMKVGSIFLDSHEMTKPRLGLTDRKEETRLKFLASIRASLPWGGSICGELKPYQRLFLLHAFMPRVRGSNWP